MEVDQIQCKFPIISNGYRKLASTKVGQSRKMNDQYPDDEEEGENKRGTANDGGAADLGGGVGRFYGWPSSRIVRVSRASGGKDRHSKVLTSKGPRDRRVRLSVNTAIQFYDLQDRLGYDQPSKAVEWLLTAAASSIAELPPMNSPFPHTPKKLSNDQKRLSTRGSDQLGFDSAEVAMDLQQEQVTKSSICSSNSETSKGSGLSISRSESRIQARERAKERFAEKEKEKESESSYVASFTELLSGGINSINGGCNSNSISPNGSVHQNPNRGSGENSTDESTFFQKSPRQWSSSPMDYFTSGLLVPPAATRPGQIVASPPFIVAADHHPELQPFSFVPDNLVSASASSSGLAAFNRGTLQSNSSSSSSLSSLLSHVQRFPHTDGSSPNFFIGATAAPIENRHHFLPGFDARLQLYYGDAHGNNGRYAGQKGKEKHR